MSIDHDARRRAAWVSLFVGSALFLGKLATWQLTGSVAVLSDALESTVNIAAATLLVFSMYVSSRPADPDHPYGHGKVEFLSAGIEGALIGVAAILIGIEAISQLVGGVVPKRLDAGLALLVLLSAANALLGGYLIRTGRATQSIALVADGKHVIADVYTSAGVILGLLAVRITGIAWLDPAVALLVAAHIVFEGYRLGRSAIRGLMDEADPALLESLVASLERERPPSWIDIHGLRAWRSGTTVHADFHLVVPRYLDALQLHGIHDAISLRIQGERSDADEVVVHFDPCAPLHCSGCATPDCPVRSAALRERFALNRERATRADPEVVHAADALPTHTP